MFCRTVGSFPTPTPSFLLLHPRLLLDGGGGGPVWSLLCRPCRPEPTVFLPSVVHLMHRSPTLLFSTGRAVSRAASPSAVPVQSMTPTGTPPPSSSASPSFVPVSLCGAVNCGSHGSCVSTTGVCACSSGYGGLLCTEVVNSGNLKCAWRRHLFPTLSSMCLVHTPPHLTLHAHGRLP